MAEVKPLNFSLDELNKYIPSIEKLSVDISDDLVAGIKKEVENKILVSNRFRLNTEDSKKFFDIEIDHRNKRIVWNNTDKNFIFGRFLLYSKFLIDSTVPKYYGSLRPSVFCFGQVSEGDTKSNGNIDYVNDLCKTAGIPFTGQSPRETTAYTEPTPKQKTKAEKRRELSGNIPDKTERISESTPVLQTAVTVDNVTPVVGTPFLSHGYNFVLYKPSEAFLKPERKAIVDGYLYEDSVSFFFGPASSYKTFWLLWESIHIATGKELCGMHIKGGARKILFISLEMTAKDISDRIHNMTANWTADEKKLLDENFLIISSEDESRIRATSKNILDALMVICDTNNIGGIYLDAYTEYIVGLDVRSESQGDVINAMRMKANKHHVYFRVIHHSTKTTKTKDGEIDGTMAGIHTIRDTADQVYAMKLLNDSLEIRITNDPTKDSSTKPRFGKAITFTVKFVSDDERNTFSFTRLQDNETSSYIEKLKELLDIVDGNPGINSSDLKVKFGDNAVCREVIANAISDKGGRIITQFEKKSSRGSKMKCHYKTDFFTEHEAEIREGIL